LDANSRAEGGPGKAIRSFGRAGSGGDCCARHVRAGARSKRPDARDPRQHADGGLGVIGRAIRARGLSTTPTGTRPQARGLALVQANHQLQRSDAPAGARPGHDTPREAPTGARSGHDTPAHAPARARPCHDTPPGPPLSRGGKGRGRGFASDRLTRGEPAPAAMTAQLPPLDKGGQGGDFD